MNFWDRHRAGFPGKSKAQKYTRIDARFASEKALKFLLGFADKNFEVQADCTAGRFFDYEADL